MKLIISVYGSHNASIAMYYDEQYYVVEVERWLNIKNSGLIYYNGVRDYQSVFDDICEWLLSHTKGEVVDAFMVGYADAIVPKFKYKTKLNYDHHTSHAACAFYQSPYDKMLIFTFDGGGDGSFFNVYIGDRNSDLKLVGKHNIDLGFPYMCLGSVLDDIRKEPLNIGNLVYAGKLMGLCGYGTVIESWVPVFMEFYNTFQYSGDSFIGGAEAMETAMNKLFTTIGVNYTHNESRFTGDVAYNIAATSQRAFEDTFFKIADKYINEYSDIGVIGLSGGCALNVLLNTRIHNTGVETFIPPNTNDSGMAVGAIMNLLKPMHQVDLTYSGLPIMDSNMLFQLIYSNNLRVIDDVGVAKLAEILKDGKIVALVQGNSEHGSRALGNRSIVCGAGGDMKNIINSRIKKREWYRPFAPVVREQDTNKYFIFNHTSRHMTYAAPIRDEWKEKLNAVTHVDGTGRLQTVSYAQNEFLYSLLTQYENLTGVGVLLNTSLNVNGKPIASTLADIFKLLVESDMDAVWYANKLIVKSNSSLLGE